MKVLFYVSLFLHTSFSFYDTLPYPELQRRILNTMTSPAKGKGGELLLDTYNYLQFLRSFSDLESGSKESKLVAHVLANRPEFLDLKYDSDSFRKIFDWDEEQISDFCDCIEDIKMEWNKLKQSQD